IASDEFVFLITSDNKYKIATSQVTPKMFTNVSVEIDSSSNIILYLVLGILTIGIGSLIFRLWQKRATTLPLKTKESYLAPTEPINDSLIPVMSDVTFDDIGGISDVKVELEEIIDFLKNPKKYNDFGVRLPRGVLLIGPPGVGKTMIAKAVASAANVPYYYQSGASFVQVYVGMGAKRVSELFSEAKKNSPAIIFIDEIDAVGKKRDNSANEEREATLNQLLTQMDGFEDSSNIIVIAATNKIEVLDSALLRSGRFDRRIFVELPTPSEREAIVAKYIDKIPHSVDVKEIAKICVGFNGASIATLVNEAALYALRLNDEKVTHEHFLSVKDKVIYGKKKVAILTQEEKNYICRYQAAKGVVATYFDMNFEKIALSQESIKPPISAPLLKHEIEERIKLSLCGMLSCDEYFREHATNVEDDIAQAKEFIYSMCDKYAMGEGLTSSDEEKKRKMNFYYDETKRLINSLHVEVDAVYQHLLVHEKITKNEIKKLSVTEQ
ncbi:MAG: AAA family ATPase, partial [Campylobacterota bacterium]|nr:AAA family ATPase [Campylobacterota bacterium]